MQRVKITFFWLFVLLPTPCHAADSDPGGQLQLMLPSEFYALPGIEMNIHFDNIVLTKTPEAYRFEVECDVGTADEKRWTVTPQPSRTFSNKPPRCRG